MKYKMKLTFDDNLKYLRFSFFTHNKIKKSFNEKKVYDESC